MKLISKCLVVFVVVCIALTFNLLCHSQNTVHATVEHLETKITPHEDTPIIVGNHSLKYVVVQDNGVFGAVKKPVTEYRKSDIVEYLPRDSTSTCYDYSIVYNKQNPEYGIVVVSDKMNFQGLCHFFNYKINEDKTLTIHDEKNMCEYNLAGWELSDTPNSPEHMHFFVNGEVPRRSWRMLRPNAGAVYNEL